MARLGRLHKIIIAISLSLIIQLFSSLKLWIPHDREVPLISAFSFLNVHLGYSVDALLFGAVIILLIGLFFYPFNKWIIASLVALFFLLVLEDITRFQPWLYMFCVILLTATIITSEDQVLFIIRLLLSATYIWSGIQKINHAFTVEIFPWVMSPLGLQSFFTIHHRLAYAVPLFEILIGAGLLFSKFQKIAGIKLIIMHAILLYVLGPFGNSWNRLIWPWNAALIVMLYLLITEKYPGIVVSLKPLRKSVWFISIVILSFVMPAFNYFGWWDYYLSGNLYSGNGSEMIFFNDKNDTAIDKYLNQYTKELTPEKGGEYFIVNTWILDELNAPVYPEERYYKRIGKYLCNKAANKQKAGIVIIRKKKITSEQYMQNCSCDSLLKVR